MKKISELTDIVFMLRSLANFDHDDVSIGTEAANTIERLRNEVSAKDAELASVRAENAALKEQNARLREALYFIHNYCCDDPQLSVLFSTADEALNQPIERNQCDGCARGLPIPENDGIHWSNNHPDMYCTKDRYVGKPEEGK